ncbi:hypothetical protein [Streptomyces griseoloalbus]|uniref:Uncharacterized protein n=1 Tax=Streptomyces griseoloalbus TaxID=67303 RepID=A0A7W8BUL5_9ACTN|nr:hypothetical protein [Streptomyces albaduncus]MBB5129720.1 hypothetical protein [Streptomyces albaduncus]
MTALVGLGDHEVRRGLHGGWQTARQADVDRDGQCGTPRQVLDRGGQTVVGEGLGMDAAAELTQLVDSERDLFLCLGEVPGQG